MGYNEREYKLIDALVTLWRDLTLSGERGPHVALIERTLHEAGVNWHAWVVQGEK